MARIVIVQSQVSQVDEPVYAKMHALSPGAVEVLYWNDYGFERKSQDPEIGFVPDLADSLAGFYPRVWLDSHVTSLADLLRSVQLHKPAIVVVSDLKQKDRLRLALHLRRAGTRIAFRTDKNSLSETVSSGLRLEMEKRVARAAYDILAPVSSLTTQYYDWPAAMPVLAFPYSTNEDKFSPPHAERKRRRIETRQKFSLPASAHVFLSIAKFAQRENPWAVIKAFELAVAERPDLRLIAVGDGPLLAEIKAYCAREPRLQGIIFPGFVPFRSLQDYMFAADTLMHLPFIEPWGLSPQDALIAGLGIITTDRVGAAQVLLDGDLKRFMVSPTNAAAAAARMIELAAMPDSAAIFTPARIAAGEYTSSACASRWIEAAEKANWHNA